MLQPVENFFFSIKMKKFQQKYSPDNFIVYFIIYTLLRKLLNIIQFVDNYFMNFCLGY